MNAPHPWYRNAPSADPLPGARVEDRTAYTPTASERLFGGPPVAVFARLLVVSLVVGVLLMWFDIRPFEVFSALRRLVDRLWFYGWDSVRALLDYLLAGALLVVPCWLVLRLMSYRGR